MKSFFDSSFIKLIKKSNLVIDTNILAACSTDPEFFKTFKFIFKENIILIDPIVKFEFLKGTQTDSLFNKKSEFLKFNEFYDMTDHFDIYRKVYENAINIARIYSHHGKTDIKTGDVFIISRLMLYPNYFFITLDKSDFTSLLFDRASVVSIEHNSPNNKSDSIILEHICVLKFNDDKYNLCKAKLCKK